MTLTIYSCLLDITIGNKKVSRLNHQNRRNKLLDIAKSSTCSPIQEEFTLNEAKVKEFDWKVFFEEILAIKDILDCKAKELTILEEMRRNPVGELIKLEAEII